MPSVFDSVTAADIDPLSDRLRYKMRLPKFCDGLSKAKLAMATLLVLFRPLLRSRGLRHAHTW